MNEILLYLQTNYLFRCWAEVSAETEKDMDIFNQCVNFKLKNSFLNLDIVRDVVLSRIRV